MTVFSPNIIITLLLLILAFGGITLILIKVFKNKNKRTFWNFWVPVILLTIALPIIFFTVFEDKLFVKSKIKQKLEEHSINLTNSFKVISSDKSDFIDYSYQFEINISDYDKNRLIEDFTKSENYIMYSGEMYDIRYGKDRNIDTTYFATYEDKYHYSYQCYETNSEGYSPKWIIIDLSKKDNSLTFIEIWE